MDWFLRWLKRERPRICMNNHGAKSSQFGHVHGDVTVLNVFVNGDECAQCVLIRSNKPEGVECSKSE